MITIEDIRKTKTKTSILWRHFTMYCVKWMISFLTLY